jgi:hypothetical protein
MPTTRFNNNILQMSRRLNDPRTDASSSGDTGAVYTSAILAGYQNQAIRNLIKDQFLKVGELGIAAVFPELVRLSSALTLTTSGTQGSVAVPSDCWLVITLRNSGATKEFRKVIDIHDLNRMVTGEHAFLNPTAARPYFFELSGSIYTRGIYSGDVVAIYLQSPADVVVTTGAGGTDISLNAIWDGEIVDRAVAIAVADMKHAIAQTLK